MSALFVYGTLLSIGGQGHLVGSLVRKAGEITGKLYRMPAGYPAMAEGSGTVHGELVEGVDDALLALLDRYEGVNDGLYDRKMVEVSAHGRVSAAWTYVMADPIARGGVLIPSGRWRSVVRR